MQTIKTISEHSFFDLGQNPVIVDLGFCKGEFFTGIINQYLDAKVFALEANPFLYEPMSKVFMSDSIRIFNYAISHEDSGTIEFRVHTDPYCSSMYLPIPDTHCQKVQVQAISLLRFMEEQGIKKVDLLKMDIEGAEWDILSNFTSHHFDKIDQLTVEFHCFMNQKLKEKTLACVEVMKKLGYKVKNYPNYTVGCGSDYFDTLFYK